MHHGVVCINIKSCHHTGFLAIPFQWYGIAQNAVAALQFEEQHVKSNFNKDDGKIAVEFFRGGRTNIAYNCLDRHVKKGRGNQPCFLWEGNELDQSRVMTYKEVLEEVSRLVSAPPCFVTWRYPAINPRVPFAPTGVTSSLSESSI